MYDRTRYELKCKTISRTSKKFKPHLFCLWNQNNSWQMVDVVIILLNKPFECISEKIIDLVKHDSL